MDRPGISAKRFRIWPGVIFPAGLTLLLALAGWQFVASVAAEQERRNDADAALAGYAKMEAGELQRRAQAAAAAFVDARLSARAEQERNLRVEIRGVMEAVNRVLGANLERSRTQAAPRREVSGFPSGFEGIRNYLQFSRSADDGSRAVDALHACAPELGELLPAGCSLAVVENSAVEIFSLGGGAPPPEALSVGMSREFVWSEGSGEGRHWTLLLKLHAPDLHPVPGAEEIAGRLTEELGGTVLRNASWRGWLLAENGRPAAAFPVASIVTPGAAPGTAQTAPELPFTGVPGEWVARDGASRVWLEAPPRAAGQSARALTPAVAVAIARPAPPLDPVEEFLGDTRWMCTLGALTLGAIAFWMWFAWNAMNAAHARHADADPLPETSRTRSGAAQRSAPRPDASPPPSAGAEAVAAELLRRKLVRAGTPRAVADVESVIVADIAPNGGMTVTGAQDAAPPRPERVPPPLPSGSLLRLQARHRGGKGRQGSRALDGTANPVLRTLAARIRPVVAHASAARPASPETQPRPRGRVTERYMKETS